MLSQRNGLHSQHPHRSSQRSITPVAEDLMPPPPFFFFSICQDGVFLRNPGWVPLRDLGLGGFKTILEEGSLAHGCAFYLLFFMLMCTCACASCTCVWRSEEGLRELAVPFYFLVIEDQTLVIILVLLSYLAGAFVSFESTDPGSW